MDGSRSEVGEARGREAPWREIVEMISDGFVAFDRDLRYTYVNAKAGELFGRSPDSLVGKRYLEEYPEAEGSTFHQAYVRALAEQRAVVFEDHYEPWDRWFENRVYPSAGGLAVFFTEITERKLNEESLREANELVRALMRSLPLAIGTIGPDGALTSWSPAGLRQLGWSEEDLVGKGPVIVPEELREEAMGLYERTMAGETILGHETKRLHKDGRVVDVALSLAPLRDVHGDVAGIVGALRDISEQKGTQRELLRRNEELAALHDATLSLIAEDDAGTVLELIVARAASLLESEGAYVYEVAPDGASLTATVTYGAVTDYRGISLARGEGLAGRVLEAGVAMAVEDYTQWTGRARHFDRYRPGPTVAVPLRGAGEIAGVLVIVREQASPFTAADVALAERFARLASLALSSARLTSRLRENEERLRLATESANMGVWEVNVRDGTAFADERTNEILGIALESTSDGFFRLVHPDDRERVAAEVEAAHAGAPYDTEFRAVTESGETKWLRATGTVVRDHEGNALRMIGVIADITPRKLAQVALEESEERLRLATEVAQIGVWEIDLAAGRVVADPAVERMFGYEPGTFQGTREEAWQRIHPDDAGTVCDVQERALAGGGQYDVEFRTVAPASGVRWLHSVATVLRNGDGEPVRMVGVATDISAYKLAERRAREYAERIAALREIDRALLEASGVDRAVRVALPRVRRLTGADRASVTLIDVERREGTVLGADAEDAPAPSGMRVPLLTEQLEALARGEPSVVADVDLDLLPRELQGFVSQTGVRSMLSLPILVGGELFAALNLWSREPGAEFFDATVDIGRELAARLGVGLMRASAEDELRALADELEQRVAERTADAREARASAEGANAAKSEFLSRMSHELRTPLNAILGFAQLLQLDDLGREQRESVEQVSRAGRHVLELINEVLDIAGIEAGRIGISVEPLDASLVVAEALDLVAPLAAEAGIELSAAATGEHWVLADRQRLLQIFLNLLANAVTYNRPGGTVDVTYDRPRDGRVAVSFTDTGLGLRPEEVDRLFTPFERLSSATGTEGTGLGLALARGLAEAMGGDITCESVFGEGSTFTVRLLGADAPDLDVSVGAGARGAGLRLLHIEDSPESAELVRRLAAKANWDVRTASSGEEGLQLATADPPDAVLLDLNLPGARGEDVLEALRGDPTTSHVPVIMLSADATTESHERLTAAGAKAFLTKPVDFARLLEVVSGAVGAREGSA